MSDRSTDGPSPKETCGFRGFPPGGDRKRILVFGCSTTQFRALVDTLASLPECTPVGVELNPDSSTPSFRYRGATFAWEHRTSAERVLDCLETTFVNMLVIDLRGDGPDFERRRAQAFRLLFALDEVEDVEARYGFHRIVVLVSGQGDAIDQTMVELGQKGIGQVLRDPTGLSQNSSNEAARPFAQRLLEQMSTAMTRPRRELTALCAAGGGITGIYFEMGALKCLDDCFGGEIVNAFDLYFGISAGAVVTSLISNGYSIDEMMSAVAGAEGGRLPPLSMALFRLGHLDYPSLARRLEKAAATGWRHLVSALRGRSKVSFEGLLFDFVDLVGPPFRGHAFERMIRDVLVRPGATNDFRKLPRRLFVGATDQDARRHVLFGSPGHDDTPISVAVQASMSLNPAFSPTELGGRFHEDGAVTRTSNFVEAIQRGAGLVFVLDPFVPYVSRTPGFAREHGVLYNLDQNIRTVSFTRYESTRNWALRRHPDVNFYTFLPANRLRQLLSVSPMDHRPFYEIWRGAYLSTLYQVRRVSHRLSGDSSFFGLRLDTSRADYVAERLRAVTTDELTLADFYPDGKVVIPTPPLCLENANIPANVPHIAPRDAHHAAHGTEARGKPSLASVRG